MQPFLPLTHTLRKRLRNSGIKDNFQTDEYCDCFLILRDFFLRASTVENAEAKFGIDEYSDVIMLAKPVIYISAKEVCSTHQVRTYW